MRADLSKLLSPVWKPGPSPTIVGQGPMLRILLLQPRQYPSFVLGCGLQGLVGSVLSKRCLKIAPKLIMFNFVHSRWRQWNCRDEIWTPSILRVSRVSYPRDWLSTAEPPVTTARNSGLIISHLRRDQTIYGALFAATGLARHSRLWRQITALGSSADGWWALCYTTQCW